MLPYALVRLAGVELDTGRWRVAAAALARGGAAGGGDGQQRRPRARAGHARLARGRARARRSAAAHTPRRRWSSPGGLGVARGSTAPRPRSASWSSACGRPESRDRSARERPRASSRRAGWSDAALHAAPTSGPGRGLRAGRPQPARRRPRSTTFSRDAERTRRPSALALAARCRALLAPDSELDDRFADALEPSVETTGPFERARTELLYGSRLARAGRAAEATDHLSAALRVFEQLGAEPWAGRAREGIVAAGGAAPHAPDQPAGATDAARARRRARRRRRRDRRRRPRSSSARAPPGSCMRRRWPSSAWSRRPSSPPHSAPSADPAGAAPPGDRPAGRSAARAPR